MLNTHLVEQIRLISANADTGSLEIVFGGGRRLRFYFNEGELFLLDFCADKEELLARQYRLYHKVGPEIEALLVQLRQSEGVRVADYLLQQQLITEVEVEQVTRTLVEDSLCDVFGSPSEEIEWVVCDPSSYDLNLTAVKLRIQVDLLLQMVQARVSERDAVNAQINDYRMVYKLEEGAPAPDQLNDMERNVLHFVDGRKTIDELASAIRDSSLNTACYLLSLTNQGFVRPSRGSTRMRAAAAAESGQRATVLADQMAASASVEQSSGAGDGITVYDTEDDTFRPVYRIQEPPRSKAPLIILLTVLLAVLGIGYLVIATQGVREEIRQWRTKADQAISQQQWDEAGEHLSSWQETASFDPRAVKEIEDYTAELNRRFQERIDEAAGKIDEYAFDVARNLLEGVPELAPAGGLLVDQPTLRRREDVHTRLVEAEAVVANQADALAARVESDLSANKLDAALAAIERVPEVVAVRARRVLAIWRARSIDDAGHPAKSLAERAALVDLIERAHPSSNDQARLRALRQDLADAERELAEAVINLQQRFNDGDYRAVLEDIADWTGLAAGGPHATTLVTLAQRAKEIAARVDGLMSQARALIRHERDVAVLQKHQRAIEQERSKWQEANRFSDDQPLQDWGRLLQIASDCLEQPTFAEEIACLERKKATVSRAYQTVVQERIEQIQAEEERLARGLQNIIEDKQHKSLGECLESLRTYVERADVQRSAISARSMAVLQDWEAEQQARQSRREELHQAMLSDDPELVDRLGQQLRLPRLPLAIISDPPGATVTNEGETLGTTPLIIEDISPDRLDDVYRLQLRGYQPTEVAAVDAIAGWKIPVALERTAVLQAKVDGPITSEPAVFDGRIWIAGSSNLVAVGLSDGLANQFRFDSQGLGVQALDEPVYAPVVEANGQILVTTRDNVVIRLRDGTLTRQPLAGRSNHALLYYLSPVVIDRELLIVAALDGRVKASDPRQAGIIWQGAPGSPFVCAPVLIGSRVHLVRRDGLMEINEVDDGLSVWSKKVVDGAVVAAWAGDRAVVGYTERQRFRWRDDAVEVEALPQEILAAAPGVIVTRDYRVHLRETDEETGQTSGWHPVGKIPRDERRLHHVRRWNDHAVVVLGQELLVYGPRGFSLTTDVDFLPPAVADGQLIVATNNGQISVYAP